MTRDSARKSSMSNKMSMESMANMERTERTGVYERLAPSMRSFSVTLIAWTSAIGFATVIGLGALSGCASDRGDGEGQIVSEESGTEHGGTENLEIESDDGEESGVSLALDDTYDVIRKGARLILRYDAQSNSFVGTVQNTTEGVLNSVRVEVHLSTGTELGPTTPVDLAPGESVDVSLAATVEPFTGWTPHAEVGEGEHGSGSEGGEGGGEQVEVVAKPVSRVEANMGAVAKPVRVAENMGAVAKPVRVAENTIREDDGSRWR